MDQATDSRLAIPPPAQVLRDGGVDPFASPREDRLPVMKYRGRRHRWLRRVAYHEAGHAVVAWALGLKFEEVTIVPDRDIFGASLGHIGGVPEPDRVRPAPGAVEAYAAMMLGGISGMAA